MKSPRFASNESVEIKVSVLEDLWLADLLLHDDLFSVDSKLRDPIELMHFDGFKSASSAVYRRSLVHL